MCKFRVVCGALILIIWGSGCSVTPFGLGGGKDLKDLSPAEYHGRVNRALDPGLITFSIPTIEKSGHLIKMNDFYCVSKSNGADYMLPAFNKWRTYCIETGGSLLGDRHMARCVVDSGENTKFVFRLRNHHPWCGESRDIPAVAIDVAWIDGVVTPQSQNYLNKFRFLP